MHEGSYKKVIYIINDHRSGMSFRRPSRATGSIANPVPMAQTEIEPEPSGGDRSFRCAKSIKGDRAVERKQVKGEQNGLGLSLGWTLRHDRKSLISTAQHIL
jgi:hypothetical protein